MIRKRLIADVGGRPGGILVGRVCGTHSGGERRERALMADLTSLFTGTLSRIYLPTTTKIFGNSVGLFKDNVNEACLQSANVAKPEGKHFSVV